MSTAQASPRGSTTALAPPASAATAGRGSDTTKGEADTAIRGGLWREEVLDRAGRLEVELALLDSKHPGDARITIAKEPLARVKALTDAPLRVQEWWSGSRVEACWRDLRLAEEAVLDLGSRSEVMANVREARHHATFYLGGQDERTKNLVALLPDTNEAVKLEDVVPAARIALAASHETSDRQHRETRSFVNTLRVTIALLGVLAVVLLASVAAWGLAFVPAVGQLSQPVLIGVALLFGALGAMFSAIPSLAQMPAKVETFSPIRTQAVLKVVVGSWSAVIGLMAVAANLTTAETSTLAGFAMVAAIFGASQEAITRFADRKARDLGTPDSTTASNTT